MITESEQRVLEEIYKNTITELKSIQTIMGKVYDEDLALDLNKQAVKLSKIEEIAANRLAKKRIHPEPLRASERFKLWSSIQGETLLNTS
ncbi:MAG TPA: hypothetical protein IAC41_08655, partial [Candidatus Merdenecus merdavium]|nr:hypothetical protein [Candidatus Merdenecus merdavium]